MVASTTETKTVRARPIKTTRPITTTASASHTGATVAAFTDFEMASVRPVRASASPTASKAAWTIETKTVRARPIKTTRPITTTASAYVQVQWWLH
jgi:hypothetical protein